MRHWLGDGEQTGQQPHPCHQCQPPCCCCLQASATLLEVGETGQQHLDSIPATTLAGAHLPLQLYQAPTMTWPGTLLTTSHPCPSGAGPVGAGLLRAHQALCKGAGRVGARRLLTHSVMTTWCPGGRVLCRALTGASQRPTPLPCLGSQAQQVSRSMSPRAGAQQILAVLEESNAVVLRASAAPLPITLQ